MFFQFHPLPCLYPYLVWPLWSNSVDFLAVWIPGGFDFNWRSKLLSRDLFCGESFGTLSLHLLLHTDTDQQLNPIIALRFPHHLLGISNRLAICKSSLCKLSSPWPTECVFCFLQEHWQAQTSSQYIVQWFPNPNWKYFKTDHIRVTQGCWHYDFWTLHPER